LAAGAECAHRSMRSGSKIPLPEELPISIGPVAVARCSSQRSVRLGRGKRVGRNHRLSDQAGEAVHSPSKSANVASNPVGTRAPRRSAKRVRLRCSVGFPLRRICRGRVRNRRFLSLERKLRPSFPPRHRTRPWQAGRSARECRESR
jgi:hypothetical protein